jgi:hypothetical protein
MTSCVVLYVALGMRFRGKCPREFFLPWETCHIFALFFMSPQFSCPLLGNFSAHGFLFPIKELGFLTNPGHWVRVLEAAGSYMYIVF